MISPLSTKRSDDERLKFNSPIVLFGIEVIASLGNWIGCFEETSLFLIRQDGPLRHVSL